MTARLSAVNLLELDDYLSAQPAAARKAARIAINTTTARKAVPRLRKSMRKEVNFPPGYLEDESRFGQTKHATETDLSATITARFRPTSLARFASGQSFEGARRTGGVSVKVSPGGGARRIGRAFFVKLRRGKDTQDGFNVGLALRLKPGEKLRGRKKGAAGVEVAPGLHLLYGPSVDQVFRESVVADSPAIAEDLTREFIRQFVRFSGGG